MIKLLSILFYSPPSEVLGGTERQMHSLHVGLRRRGVDVRVLASLDEVKVPFQVYDTIPIWGTKFPSLTRNILHPSSALLWWRMKRIQKFVASELSDVNMILAAPFREPAVWAYLFSKQLKVPWIGRVAGSGPKGDFAYLKRHVSRNTLVRSLIPKIVKTCSALVALDDQTCKEAIEAGFEEAKISIISNSVSLCDLPKREEVETIPENGFILFLGRVAPEKRVSDLIKAYALCRAKKLSFPKLVIVGRRDGDDLEKVSGVLVNDRSILIAGHQTDVRRFLSHAVCMVNPSECEGFPNSILEAWAFGVPTVLSDIPIHRKLAVEVGMERFLFRVGDERALAEKLLSFFELTKEEITSLRARCASYARQWSCADRDEEYVTLCQRVLDEGAAHPKGGDRNHR